MSDHDVDLSERRSRVFLGPAELQGIIDSGKPVTILDVRWELGRSDGREQYESGHLPGAVFVDLETELAGSRSTNTRPTTGRHPLPDLASLQDSARSWGVRANVPVVVYDDLGGMSAARAWWSLRWGGHSDVRILDGGLDAWKARGGDIEAGDVVAQESAIVLTGGALPVLDADGAAALAASGVLIDARAAERFRGDVEPIDARAGHIPGAKSLPAAGNVSADGRLLDARSLIERVRTVGVTEADAADTAVPRIGVYCGSGVAAAHEIAVLASLGVDAALYPGSWSQWASEPERPVGVGE
jgi:thiosulfate/3-mercaptopyruvate sulfurtransferase